MKILIVSPFFPFPLESGGKTRLYNLVKQLIANGVEAQFLYIDKEEVPAGIRKKFEESLPGIKVFTLINNVGF